MRKIDQIVIHCSVTPKGKFFDVDDIREWHVKGNGWTDVGYHYIVLLDGTIQLGRPIEVPGAHVSGYNHNSIGVCYIGGGSKGNWEDTRTVPQFSSLYYLLKTLKLIFKQAAIVGHRDFEGVKKLCPCFNAMEEYQDL